MVLVNNSNNREKKKKEFMDQLRKKTRSKIVLFFIKHAEFNEALDENKKENQAISPTLQHQSR